MSANRYTVSATMKAVRDIFEQNPGIPLETRWKRAKASEMFQGFELRCRTTAGVLLAAAVPPCLVILTIGRGTLADNRPIFVFVAIAYVALSMAISWRLGIKAAAKGMANRR